MYLIYAAICENIWEKKHKSKNPLKMDEFIKTLTQIYKTFVIL